MCLTMQAKARKQLHGPHPVGSFLCSSASSISPCYRGTPLTSTPTSSKVSAKLTKTPCTRYASLSVNALSIRSQLVTNHSINQLYNNGARTFLLLNIPPLDLAPTPEDSEVLVKLIESFNHHIQHIQNAFDVAHPDARIRMFDLNALLRRLIAQPTAMSQTAKIRNTTANCWPYNP